MSRLQILQIGPPVTAGLEHFSSLPLKTLHCGGPERPQEEFDAIGNIETLQLLDLTTNNFDAEKLGALANLKDLERLFVATVDRTQEKML